MKTFAYLLLVPLIAGNASKCSEKKQKPEGQTTAVVDTVIPNPATGSTDTGSTAGNTGKPDSSLVAGDTYRFIASFASKGAGIDYKTKEVFMKWIEEFRPVVKAEEYHWGREGEVDVCLKLTELSTRDQERFVREARMKLADKDLIFVDENKACRHKR